MSLVCVVFIFHQTVIHCWDPYWQSLDSLVRTMVRIAAFMNIQINHIYLGIAPEFALIKPKVPCVKWPLIARTFRWLETAFPIHFISRNEQTTYFSRYYRKCKITVSHLFFCCSDWFQSQHSFFPRSVSHLFLQSHSCIMTNILYSEALTHSWQIQLEASAPLAGDWRREKLDSTDDGVYTMCWNAQHSMEKKRLSFGD